MPHVQRTWATYRDGDDCFGEEDADEFCRAAWNVDTSVGGITISGIAWYYSASEDKCCYDDGSAEAGGTGEACV